jgi:transcriptional regulator with XRE-family HTH domain
MNQYDIQKFYIDLGSNIQAIRKQQKINQDKLAEDVGLNRTSIVNIEKGRQKVLIHTLINIASALDADLKELIPIENPFNIFIVNSQYDELPENHQQAVKQVLEKK